MTITVPSAAAPPRRRQLIEQSWDRMRRQGIRPDRRVPSITADGADEARRGASELLSLVPMMNRHLGVLTDDEVLVFVLADEGGRVVHRESSGTLRDNADRLGFAVGAGWGERQVGTNAIGTALVSRQAVQIHAREHFLMNQYGWSCAAVPIRDPRTSGLMGVVDVSVAAEQAHPATLSLASLLAHAAHLELRERHRRDLDVLRQSSWAHPATSGGEWLVVDENGWIADAAVPGTLRRVRLPAEPTGGALLVPGVGDVEAIPVRGGWILRPEDGQAGQTAEIRLRLQTGEGGAAVLLESATARHRVELSSRHAQLLGLIMTSATGASARELSEQVYGSAEHAVAVRAEISRLRRLLGDLIVAGPYRLAPGVVGQVDVPLGAGTR
ncbi:GAF domain-containing protein [Mycetocola reblochoni]|uniref:Transcriptional regulator n=2 Tax=Mycetocola reblochoni TaxID=331618 RepID=A0A1R4ILD5_9MICO|nr:GAF domain-containing protein [Mycetocola reblochoni]SJN20475.1 Transcriptional regulator [Mycetocola reblochoni REB411]